MRKINLFLVILVSVFLVGCSTKREYFSPEKEQISGDMPYNGSLNSPINYTTLSGATLKNGQIVAKSGILGGVSLEKGEMLINLGENFILSSNVDGNFYIRNLNGEVIFSEKFPVQIISAQALGDTLVLVGANNALYILKNGNLVMNHQDDTVYTIDSRVASPVFLDTQMVLVPMLNGKLLLVHTPSAKVVQDMYVSSEIFFNNIIFLEVLGDRIYAATNTDFVLIAPSGNQRVIESIKDIKFANSKFYLFKKDGVVSIYDMNLNELRSKKFKFAQFSGAIIKDSYLYIFERNGYLIKTDLNLENEEIFELNSEIDEKSFAGDDKFYFKDRYLGL